MKNKFNVLKKLGTPNMKLFSKKTLAILLVTLFSTQISFSMYTVDQVKDLIYEQIKANKTYTYKDALNQVNKYNKPNYNKALPLDMPKDNRLVISKIEMNMKILEANDVHKISHGAWRVPDGSTPDKGGNTVIIGHRVSLAGGIKKPWDFFYLPEVKKGDMLDVYWKGKRYTYKVFNASVEDPEDSDMHNSSKESILTVYTCYPLWTTDYRYAVQAKLIETSSAVRK